ncbi:MAG TPA: hypothetical protein PKX93_00070 [bacterium]|nr:hypothetical protein [bacterium]HOL65836.1 hypothetical protein [bacterium]HPP11114.1 hypothetical protein [bacterium]
MRRFLLLSVFLLWSSLGRGEESAESLRQELRRLTEELSTIKQTYEQRIKLLEERISQMERKMEPEVAAPSVAEKKTSSVGLPDISVIGDIQGNFGPDREGDDSRNKLFLQELELGLQGYLFPEIRADAFVSLHRHPDGEYQAELEEGYVSFLNLGHGFSAQLGKKLISFGKLNPIHPHHWDFVDRPLVLKEYLGDHGLAGNGVSLSYQLPLPFFAQVESGAWYVDSEHVHGELPMVSPADEVYTARVWFGGELGQTEMELGFSGLKGYGSHHEQHLDKLNLYGADLTMKYFGPGYRRLLWRNEILHCERKIPPGTVSHWGGYTHLNWRWDKYWNVGFRYDWVQPPFPKPLRSSEKQSSLILTRNLSEMTSLRFQAFTDMKDDYGVYLQVLFGIGPHSHPLE